MDVLKYRRYKLINPSQPWDRAGIDGQIFNIPSFIFYCTMKPNTCVSTHEKTLVLHFLFNHQNLFEVVYAA